MKKQFLLILAASLILTACGSKGGGTNMADIALPVNGFGNFATVGASSESASMKMESAEMPEVEEGHYDGGSDQLVVKENRKLIRNVTIEMETTDFSTTIDEISRRTEEMGGYIESSGISGDSIGSTGTKYASFTIRIPQDRLDEFLDAAAEAGSVTYKSENVEDITLQYADTESRIKSLKTEQERLWELMEQADSIDTIIALNQRLSEISYDLESYESRLKTYDNKVDYSTVRLSVNEVKTYTEQTKDGVFTRIQKGFNKNLAFLLTTGENIFVWFFSNILSIELAVLSVLFVIAARNRIKRKKAQKEGNTETLQNEKKAENKTEKKINSNNDQKPKNIINLGKPKE